jgi:hypothetical protein
MAQMQVHVRDWFMLAERGMLRVAMIVVGLLLIVIGLGMSMSVVLLLPGLVIGFCGIGLVVCGAVTDLPIT